MATGDTSSDTRGFHEGRRCRRCLSSISLLVEPSAGGTDVDYRYLYELVADRAEREEDRNKALDAKITALLAGVVAFIGFSFRLQTTPWSAIAGLLYLGPLGFLLAAFMTKPNRIAPTAESLVTFFPLYPVQTLRDAAVTMERACRINDDINDVKTKRLSIATALTAAATAVVLVTQCVIALR